jgi:predicted nucleic acid-binding protein
VKIVLDTSALISAIRSPTGAAAEIVRLAILGTATLLLDYKLGCEYREVALRPAHVAKSGGTAAGIGAIVDALEAIAVPVLVVRRHRPLSNDRNDDMVLDVAINRAAEVVVTNNVKHFETAALRFGIKTLTPSQFLNTARKGGLL